MQQVFLDSEISSRKQKLVLEDVSAVDLLLANLAKLRLVKSAKLELDGHEEEKINRRKDHWLSQTS